MTRRPHPLTPPRAPTDPRAVEAPGDARQVRLIAGVLAGTMAVWMFASWAGGHYGWPARWAFLFDFLALAAFAWALIVTGGLWRARRARRAAIQTPHATGVQHQTPHATGVQHKTPRAARVPDQTRRARRAH